MIRGLGIVIAVVLVVLFAVPFGRDAYHRYIVSERLKSVLTPQERAEFDNWNGTAVSFAETLYARCELTQGKSAVQCDRYKYAYELR